MRNNALYFPYIEIPDVEWTYRLLLYWDRLSSIVPINYVHEPEHLNPFMRQLVTEGLVEQVIPGQYLYTVPQFEDNFIALLESRMSRMPKRIGKRSFFLRKKDNKPVKVHVEKLGQLPYWLVNNGLAKESEYPWYEMEKWVANLFMAYLATVLGALKEISAAPVSNSVEMGRIFGHLRSPKDAARDILLEGVLPIPKGRISIDSLTRFKSEHGKLLPKLREKIEIYSGELATIENLSERRARSRTIIHECNEEICEIEEAMRTSWNSVTFGSLMPLIGSGAALHAASISGEPVAVGAAGIAFVTAAYQSLSNVRSVGTIENKPLAYLAHVRAFARNA